MAFIVDPLSRLKAWKDSTIAMMRAAEKHGHEVYAIDCASLGWRRPEAGHAGGVFGEAVHLHLRPDDHDWYRETGVKPRRSRASTRSSCARIRLSISNT
jgi:glutathione synthase